MIQPPARKLHVVPAVIVSSITNTLSGHVIWKFTVTHWCLHCYSFTVMHLLKLFSEQHKYVKFWYFCLQVYLVNVCLVLLEMTWH